MALLDAIVELGRVAGLDEAGSLAIYGPLIEGTLGNARALGVSSALTGPIARGDLGHRSTRTWPPCDSRPRCPRPLLGPWREREVDLAVARGSLAPERAHEPCAAPLQGRIEPVP